MRYSLFRQLKITGGYMSEDMIFCVAMFGVAITVCSGVAVWGFIERRNMKRDMDAFTAHTAWRKDDV